MEPTDADQQIKVSISVKLVTDILEEDSDTLETWHSKVCLQGNSLDVIDILLDVIEELEKYYCTIR